jgi:ankyrin repeat protein
MKKQVLPKGGCEEQQLCAAITAKDAVKVQALVATGAMVNCYAAESDEGHSITPLMLAAECGSVDIARLLLNAGADPNARDSHVYVGQGRGRTALYYAAACDRTAVLELLLRAGAVCNVYDSLGISPLTAACLAGSEKAALTLIQAGAEVIPRRSRVRLTPLSAAVSKRHTGLVNFLLDHGADVTQADDTGSTPLMTAATTHDYDMVMEILRRHPDVNAQELDGFTALMYACTIGAVPPDLRIVKALLDAGADPRLKDREGRTALTIAKYSYRATEVPDKKPKYAEIVRLLSKANRVRR